MASIDNKKLIDNDNAQNGNKSSTQVVIITSVDDDNDKMLSYINPSNVETFLLNLNQMDEHKNHKQNIKRSLSESDEEISYKTTKTKKSKTGLTCVICGGHANCYNFGQITCDACKAFFRRNAFQPLEKINCIKDHTNRTKTICDIRYNVKQKCQLCRILKCFQFGMRKDHILTTEQKQSRLKRLEENRCLRTGPTNNFLRKIPIEKEEIPEELVNIPEDSSSTLTESDWLCLTQIQDAYSSASQSNPSASSVMSLELGPDKMSAYMNTFDIQNFLAVKLINFVRSIPEFEQLDERDRLILVKYNLTLLFLISHSLNFDSARELCFDIDTTTDVVSPSDEAFAQHCKSLFILCYGYEFNRMIMSILHVLVNIVNKDPIIVQLLMLITIFSKGLSADEEPEPVLIDEYPVYNAQSKYIDLLFRYLLQQSSFEIVAMKMTHITEQLLKIQKVLRDFHQYIKNKVDLTNMNPLMKSLLHIP